MAAERTVAVLIVNHNGGDLTLDCLRSLRDAGEAAQLYVVDNASADDSVERIRAAFSDVTIIESEVNLGFAGGNNLGWRHIRQALPNVDYLMLLNQDTLVTSGCLQGLADGLDAHPEAGAAQPKIVLHPETNRINTAGNVSHFLGFGFTTGCGEVDHGQFDQPRSVDFCSGAAVMLRAAAVREVGLFDDLLFMYLEDAELGWKLREAGYDSLYEPAAVVQHKYAFADDYRHYYWLERNRWLLLLGHYRWPTLLLIAPAAIAMEALQFVFALLNGRLRERLRAWGFFLWPPNWRLIAARRRRIFAHRSRSERECFGRFIGALAAPQLRSSPALRLVSPLFAAYWGLAHRLIRW